MEPTDHNRRAWDEVHRGAPEAMRGDLGLPEQAKRSLGDLKGKRILHLQCGTGEATLELAELGAVVTGVDSSEVALEIARERESSVLWVHSEVQSLPAELRRARFDLVYAADGVLPWLLDLDAWALAIVAALKQGGDLLLFETHPVAQSVDSMMHWRESYFEATRDDVRFWRLGQTVTALAGAGLTIRALEEYPARRDSFRRQDARLPGEFLLHARKA
ncbi:MAG: class I SAM-dependent methyltransferase [Thermoleophilia bacterium]